MERTKIGILIFIMFFSFLGVKVKAAVALPDLVVDDWLRMGQKPEDSALGFYNLNFKVTNIGSVEIKNFPIVEVSISTVKDYSGTDSNGNVIDWARVSNGNIDLQLKPKESAVGFKMLYSSVGDTVTITVDPGNLLAEADETNNSRSFLITQERLDNLTALLPDLVMKDTFLEYNGKTAVFFKVCNDGLEAADFTAGKYTDLSFFINQAGGSMSIPASSIVGNQYGAYSDVQIDLLYPTACWIAEIPFSKDYAKKWHNQISLTLNKQENIAPGTGSILIQEIDYTNNSLTKEIFGQQVFAVKRTAPAANLWNRLKGRILLQVQRKGEAYYLEPKSQKIYYLKDGQAAYQTMRKASLGISESNYDILNSASSEGKKLRASLSGRIVLRVQAKGEAYYINPKDLSVTYMADGDAAYAIMRSKGEGIASDNLAQILDY